jgi:1-deoxy-D-xylulose-5-phosphate reductoisomerase
MRGVSILGSTGSIGTQTLAIIDKNRDRFHVVALSAGTNLKLLREQVRSFHPQLVSVKEPSAAALLAAEFPGLEVVWGDEGNCTVAESSAEVVVIGIVGFAALLPTLKAIDAKKTVAIANKESLVVAGGLLRQHVEKSGSRLIPVDSEHNALFQLLERQPREHVRSLVLTASGGPLFRLPGLPLEDVTPDLAIRHPNWKMGPKISVDSATLMNKGLELIEAHLLFDFPQNQIEVWIHPQSILHGAIWLTDNSCLAQLSQPDMRSSLGFALHYPERLSEVIPKLSLKDMAKLEFFEPDVERFPALSLARAALAAGPAALIALNASNEVAVGRFLEKKILFPQMAQVIERVLEQAISEPPSTLEATFQLDAEARRQAELVVSGLSRRTS